MSANDKKRARPSDDCGRKRRLGPSLTLEILGSQQNTAEMMLLDEVTDLGGDLGAIPSHDQHLPDRP